MAAPPGASWVKVLGAKKLPPTKGFPQPGPENPVGIGNNQTFENRGLEFSAGCSAPGASAAKQTKPRQKKLKHMYQSNQITNKNQLVRKSPYRLSLAPWAAGIGLAVAMFLSPSGAFATITNFPSWEVASEFNDSINPASANPSGVWSYGEKPTVVGAFTLLNFLFNPNPDVSGWTNASSFPHVSHNVNAVTVVGSGLVATLPPHALVMHPGPSGAYAVLRFTAPARGKYKVSGQFYALDDNGGGTTTDVWIVPNNTTVGSFSGNVDYSGNAKFVSFTSHIFQLQSGGTLDFEVGYGSNLDYNFDSTGLNAVIEKIR
jgi:hypothetical protein